MLGIVAGFNDYTAGVCRYSPLKRRARCVGWLDANLRFIRTSVFGHLPLVINDNAPNAAALAIQLRIWLLWQNVTLLVVVCLNAWCRF